MTVDFTRRRFLFGLAAAPLIVPAAKHFVMPKWQTSAAVHPNEAGHELVWRKEMTVYGHSLTGYYDPHRRLDSRIKDFIAFKCFIDWNAPLGNQKWTDQRVIGPAPNRSQLLSSVAANPSSNAALRAAELPLTVLAPGVQQQVINHPGAGDGALWRW